MKEAFRKIIRKFKRKKRISQRKASIKNASFSLFEVISIIVITAVVVSVCSAVMVYLNYNSINDKIGKNSVTLTAYEELYETYAHIVESYVNDIDEEELVDSAIQGMFNYLDDVNTEYLEQSETEALQEKLSGKYTGIGIQIQSVEGNIILQDVFDDTPASEAGLKVGDILIAINGESLVGKDASYLAEILKKESGETYVIDFTRDGIDGSVTIKTASIQIPSVTSEMKGTIGYIKISTFAENTYEQFNIALTALEKQNMTGLIIDVRSNTGGYLDTAYNIADIFVKKDNIIYQLRDKDGVKTNYKAKNSSYKTYKIVVLINSSSASASEVLAAALRDNNDAILVGKTSYGKGTVQETQNLTTGSMIKYTTAYWLTPEGICIDKIGLKPDIEVEYDLNDDKQLTAALGQFK